LNPAGDNLNWALQASREGKMYKWYAGEKAPSLKVLCALMIVSFGFAEVAVRIWRAYGAQDPNGSDLPEYCVYFAVFLLVLRILFWLFFRDRRAK
jgi:hypothetical protein